MRGVELSVYAFLTILLLAFSSPTHGQSSSVKACPSDMSPWGDPPRCAECTGSVCTPIEGERKQRCETEYWKKKIEADQHNREVERCSGQDTQSLSASRHTSSSARQTTEHPKGISGPPERPSAGTPQQSDIASRLSRAKPRAEGSEIKNQQQQERFQTDSNIKIDSERAEYNKKIRDQADERRRKELAEAAKWRCFGGPSNVGAGFRQCRNECENFYSASHCEERCYANETSLLNGRSCYKRP